MRTAKISELKAKLSAHIEYVKRGEEVLILDRNTPVARLVSVRSDDNSDEREERLIAKGILTPPIDPRNKKDFRPIPSSGRTISDKTMKRVWKEERGER